MNLWTGDATDALMLPETEQGKSIATAQLVYAAMQEGAALGILTEQSILDLQCELWALLGKRTSRFTMGDSSSVPVETAQGLLHSVCFSIGLELRKCPGLRQAAIRLGTEGIAALFELGKGEVKKKVIYGRALLEKLLRTAVPTNNRAFLDTVHKALPMFFKRYDADFFAHDITCDIDYQLFCPVEELEGVEYINEYLRRLLLENRFVCAFEPDTVYRLLEGYCVDPVEQLINLFEPVFVNAVGLALLEQDCRKLNIREGDRDALLHLLSGCSSSALETLVEEATVRLCEKVNIELDGEMHGYLLFAQRELCGRIELQIRRNDFKGLFPSFRQERFDTDVRFQDNPPMADEDLRALISEMRSCRYTSDKIAMLRHHVHSLRDYIEFIPECFEESEFEQAFALLSDAEISVLVRMLRERRGDDWQEIDEEGWEAALLRFAQVFPVQQSSSIAGGTATE